jgi:dihydrolipoamide dehydrogenase
VDNGEVVAFFEFGSAIVATGSRSIVAEGISPEAALEIDQLPSAMAVHGSGYIAVELATAFARLGGAVTLRTDGPVLLPELDEPLLSRALSGGLRRLGVTVLLGEGMQAALGGGALLVDAAGREPNTADLGLERVGVRPDAMGRIPVDAQQRTGTHTVFAVGDVTPGPMLAHRAIAEGRVAAEAAAGLPAAMDVTAMPLAFFTEPEVAVVGLSERAAREQGIDARVGRFPFAAAGRALTLAETDGFLQIVAERGTDRVLGVQIVGAGATELIGEAALAIEMTATLEDLALTLHPHPTLAESFAEAADLLLDRPRHIYRKRDPET